MSENKISCDVCRDLLPLVKDGVASADSEAAVKEHIGGCSECEMLFDGKFVPAVELSETPRPLLRVKRWLSIIYAVLLMLGLYFGLSLTASDNMFYNCLIMPVAGILGYLIFKLRAFFFVPVIMFVTFILTNTLGVFDSAERIEFLGLVSFTFIYSLFTWAGMLVAMLLRFAFSKNVFGKERKK